MDDRGNIVSLSSNQRLGANDNVEVNGARFHVQTEDLGLPAATIVTHVFDQDGRVIKVIRLDYSGHASSPNLRQALPKVVRVHHRAIKRRLLDGGLAELPALIVLKHPTAKNDEAAASTTRPVPTVRRRTTTPPNARRRSSVAPPPLPFNIECGETPTTSEEDGPQSSLLRAIQPLSEQQEGKVEVGVDKCQAKDTCQARLREAVLPELPPSQLHQVAQPTPGAPLAFATSSAGPRGAATIWERLVQQAHRHRGAPEITSMPIEGASRALRSDPTSNGKANSSEENAAGYAWALAVEQTRKREHSHENVSFQGNRDAQASKSDRAAMQFEEGKMCLSDRDLFGALVRFAECVQLEPHSSRYRLALLALLKRIDP